MLGLGTTFLGTGTKMKTKGPDISGVYFILPALIFIRCTFPVLYFFSFVSSLTSAKAVSVTTLVTRQGHEKMGYCPAHHTIAQSGHACDLGCSVNSYICAIYSFLGLRDSDDDRGMSKHLPFLPYDRRKAKGPYTYF
jgi:hypothetical protein